jgi:hypothetical protein
MANPAVLMLKLATTVQNAPDRCSSSVSTPRISMVPMMNDAEKKSRAAS